VDDSGNVYVADWSNDSIRKITPSGVVTTLAGGSGLPGSEDGPAGGARFASPSGVAAGPGGIYVADSGNFTIRLIAPGGVVTTLAGNPPHGGTNDGTGTAARFTSPEGLTIDRSGNLYVIDVGSMTIRRVTPAGEVTTLPIPVRGDSLAVDNAGNLYVGEDYAAPRSAIDKVTPAGVVTTLAGVFGNPKWGSHLGVAVDSSGTVYVADQINHTISKVTQAGVVTLAGKAPSPSEDPWQAGGYADGMGSAARFNMPSAVAVDGSGNVLVADTGNVAIRHITPDGMVTTLAGTPGAVGNADGVGRSARFTYPMELAVDSAGNVYVTDSGAVRRITPDGVVSTVAGTIGVAGSADGIGSAAQFGSWAPGVAVDAAGNLYLADPGNSRITKGTPIIVPAPRFTTLAIAGGEFTATLSGLLPGTTLVIESSANLRDWLPLQTSLVGSSQLTLTQAINPASAAGFLRASLK